MQRKNLISGRIFVSLQLNVLSVCYCKNPSQYKEKFIEWKVLSIFLSKYFGIELYFLLGEVVLF